MKSSFNALSGSADNSSMADPTPNDVQSFIAAGLSCQHLAVEGDGRHFFATIVSTEFDGLSRVKRHQRVYLALGDRMREQIHALSMKTLTPAEFAASTSDGSAASSSNGLHHHR
jgi:acid stress-induced BolA-like protein IbaG/YrbA